MRTVWEERVPPLLPALPSQSSLGALRRLLVKNKKMWEIPAVGFTHTFTAMSRFALSHHCLSINEGFFVHAPFPSILDLASVSSVSLNHQPIFLALQLIYSASIELCPLKT